MNTREITVLPTTNCRRSRRQNEARSIRLSNGKQLKIAAWRSLPCLRAGNETVFS